MMLHAARLAVARRNASHEGPIRLRRLPAGINAYIGKAHALLHSAAEATVVLDSDSRVCQGWATLVEDWVSSGRDLLWSKEVGHPFGGLRDANASYLVSEATSTLGEGGQPFTLTGAARRRLTRVAERNTGTVFGVRRSKTTARWLRLALDLYPKLRASGMVVGNHGLSDQPALREAFFLVNFLQASSRHSVQHDGQQYPPGGGEQDDELGGPSRSRNGGGLRASPALSEVTLSPRVACRGVVYSSNLVACLRERCVCSCTPCRFIHTTAEWLWPLAYRLPPI